MKPSELLFGVEIEVENVDNIVELAAWKPEHEAMLKGGVEYVLKKPLKLSSTKDAVSALYEGFTNERFTQRCGIHVHVDIRKMTRVELFNFITLYTILEPLILNCLLPPERIGNNFCLPLDDALELENALVRCAMGEQRLQDLTLGGYKYGAMNLASVGNLGSLEFRAFHGTRDVDELLFWLDVLNALATYALKDNLTPPEIVTMMSELTPLGFVSAVLPQPNKFITPEMDELVYRGVRNAQRFAFMGDWDE